MSVGINRSIKSVSLGIFFLLILGIAYVESHAEEAKLAQATFYVY